MPTATKKDLRSSLSIQVRRFRERCGWSQMELAGKVSVSRSTINRIERGHHTPEGATIYRLADAFGCSADDLRQAPR